MSVKARDYLSSCGPSVFSHPGCGVGIASQPSPGRLITTSRGSVMVRTA
jgi:hypothetical protein